jgi:dethiobiotin synthetase
VETGVAEAPEDALLLRAACGPPNDSLPIDQCCPYRFGLPAAPLVAAEAEGREVDVERLVQLVAAARGPSPLLVEAAGGLLVPLARESGRLLTNLDLFQRLALPVLLVARAGLGTLNQCALSAWALRERGLRVVAVVLNRSGGGPDDPSVPTNAGLVAELTGLPVVGPLPCEPRAAQRPAALGRELQPLADRLADYAAR